MKTAHSASRFPLLLPVALVPFALWKFPGLLQNFLPGCSLKRKIATEEKTLWLTIDDGPGRSDTSRMLKVLDAHGARASFFLVGKIASLRPQCLRDILSAGHTVENHSYSHRSATLWLESYSRVYRDLALAQEVLGAAGAEPRFFRAPAGRWSHPMARAAKELSLDIAGWSTACGDGMSCGNLWNAMNRALARIHPGSILLIHQGGRQGRPEALNYLLHHLHRRGWKTTLPSPSDLVPR